MSVENGAIDMVPAIQFTDDTTDLSGVSNVSCGTRRTAVGVFPPTGWTSLAATAPGKRYYRTGFLAKSVTDATHANARVEGDWTLLFD